MGKLFLLFTIVPLVELYLLLLVARHVGFLPTVGIVLVTGLIGALLAKREGLRVLGQWRQTLAQGQMPPEGLLGAVLVLVGGVLLVAPGLLTDITGFLLLLPPSRRFIAARVRRRLERSIKQGSVRVTTFGGGGGFGGMGGFGGFGGFGGVDGRSPPGAGPTATRTGPTPADVDPWTRHDARQPPHAISDAKRGDAEVEDAELVEDDPPRKPPR